MILWSPSNSGRGTQKRLVFTKTKNRHLRLCHWAQFIVTATLCPAVKNFVCGFYLLLIVFAVLRWRLVGGCSGCWNFIHEKLLLNNFFFLARWSRVKSERAQVVGLFSHTEIALHCVADEIPRYWFDAELFIGNEWQKLQKNWLACVRHTYQTKVTHNQVPELIQSHREHRVSHIAFPLYDSNLLVFRFLTLNSPLQRIRTRKAHLLQRILVYRNVSHSPTQPY